MNRHQAVLLAAMAANLALILLFPPFDYLPLGPWPVPTFEGFRFFPGTHPNSAVNPGFLALEVIVVLVNTGIAFLLLRRGAAAASSPFSAQWAVLAFTAVNLVLVMLFPPFESAYAVTRASIPTFEAFYFVFGDNAGRAIVMPILTLEVVFILANGLLFWLLFRRQRDRELTPEEALGLAAQARRPAGHDG